jgi:2-polyprenyl-3-methyl-5-hydroxy-6-metoxy-1,4-benzoquinol methylase/glycosyltransferase involved in cell wall biosynthesis
MKLAYFSPLGPQRSGISDYSEELLPHLARAAEITLFVDGFHPLNRELTAGFEVCDYRRQRNGLRRLEQFDAVVYHMGNDHRYHAGILDAMQQRRGFVVFHDFALQEFFLGLARERGDLRIYLDEVEFCHGRSAREEATESLARGAEPAILARPVDFPLNHRIAKLAEGIIVHSEWSRARFAAIAPAVPVARIAMPVKFPEGAPRRGPTEILQIASFGLITPGKGIEQSMRALAVLKQTHRFRYSLVGETNHYFDVRDLVRRYGMEDFVEITGHVPLDEFKRRIDETDIALNIRERTVGETSASLCRLLAAGVCSVVADAGWYGELPNDAVVKIGTDAQADKLLLAYLERLIEDAELRTAIGENARRYALREFDVAGRAADYLDFIGDVCGQRPRRNLIEGVTQEMSLLGINAGDELVMRGIAAEVANLIPPKADRPLSFGGNGQPLPSNGKESSELRLTHGRAGRMAKPEGIDYKRAAVEYPDRLDAERSHYLRTKPFYNLANKPDKHQGEGMDAETHRHFCDFANIAVTLGLPAGSRILDVGCGSGWMSEYFARLGYEVKGIDISPALIEMSRDRVARVPFDVDHETTLRCSFAVHDIELAPLAEKFDAVLCYDSLHHFEDENAVMRNLSAMLPVGGVLFILEGERPPEGSATERELFGVMSEYGTLESPFDYGHLRQILDEHGLAVIGDYASVNGLFEREKIDGDRLPLAGVALNYHYLACKKVASGAAASTVPDSRRPGLLRARITLVDLESDRLKPGEFLDIELAIENTGDTLWLAGNETRTGIVMPGVRIIDSAGTLVSEFHGEPPLPRAVAPGETISLRIEHSAPQRPGKYQFKFDLVDQQVCWFEDVGSEPLMVGFEVLEVAQTSVCDSDLPQDPI